MKILVDYMVDGWIDIGFHKNMFQSVDSIYSLVHQVDQETGKNYLPLPQRRHFCHHHPWFATASWLIEYWSKGNEQSFFFFTQSHPRRKSVISIPSYKMISTKAIRFWSSYKSNISLIQRFQNKNKKSKKKRKKRGKPKLK